MKDHFKHCFGFIYSTENKKGEKGTVLLTEALKANTTLTQLFMKCLEERQWTFEIQSVHEKKTLFHLLHRIETEHYHFPTFSSGTCL